MLVLWTLVAVSLSVGGAAGVPAAGAEAGTRALAIQGRVVHFPADQSAHHVQNEWWYVVGHLSAGHQTFGYEVTIFKFQRIQPPGFSFPISLYRTDIAITDESHHRFVHRIQYSFPQSARASFSGLDLHVGSASLSGAPEHMRLQASIPGGRIDVTLRSRRVPMLVGGHGYIPFANGYTYYYSLTDLASTGSLEVGHHSYTVSGTSWLDHQWGRWAWQTVRGWTWMALQLGNGVQLSVFDFRSTVRRVRAASVLLAGGKLRTIYGATISSSGAWRSPHTHAVYPTVWIVHIPSLGTTLKVRPTVADQELTLTSQLRTSYWEGSSSVRGIFEGHAVTGLAYVELTGYAAIAA